MTEAQASLTVGRGLGGGLALLDYGKTIALLGEGELAEADGRRLAAAFNACKGITTEALEGAALYIQSSGHYCDGMTEAWSDCQTLVGRLAEAERLLQAITDAYGVDGEMSDMHAAWAGIRAFLNPEGDSAAGSEVQP